MLVFVSEEVLGEKMIRTVSTENIALEPKEEIGIEGDFEIIGACNLFLVLKVLLVEELFYLLSMSIYDIVVTTHKSSLDMKLPQKNYQSL